MTFRDIRKQTIYDLHLDPTAFAEIVTYTPRGGASRNVTVHPESEKDYEITDQLTSDEIDKLIVMCARDPSATSGAGTLRGGIDDPKIGDTILRPASVDPRQEVYAFTGEIRDEKHAKWRLVFERKARPAQGIPD